MHTYIPYLLLIGCGISAIAVGAYLVYNFRDEEKFDTPKKIKGKVTEVLGIRKTVDGECLDETLLKNDFITEKDTSVMIIYSLDNGYNGYILLDDRRHITYISSSCSQSRISWDTLVQDVQYLKEKGWEYITSDAIERCCGIKVGNEY